MNPRTLPQRLATAWTAAVCFALLASSAGAQTVAAPQPAAAQPDEDLVVLSPFEVVTDTKGYYSANTMSGTRFNTRIEDLASSVTIVTKEQMNDFAMLDINDVFLYAGNTEGSGTYTDYVMDRNGQVTDNVQTNPTQANRVRGMSFANVSYGNFETMGRTPIDPIVLDAIEISRGPNANVFGLGNPSGTVNQLPSAANVTRNRTRAELRADDYDGWRYSLDHNQVLLKDKLALRISGVRQHEGFQRKPSGIDTERFNAMVKYQPFKNTTINASYLYYHMEGNRPNFTPPRDNVSYWVESGRPAWNPDTQRVTLNGVVSAPYINDNALPSYFSRAGAGGANSRSNIYIDRGGIGYWSAPVNNTGISPNANTGSGVTYNATTGAVIPNGYRRLMFPTPGPNASLGRFTNQPLFVSTPSVVDRALYDYSSINLAAPNFIEDKSETFMVTLDQIFLNTPRHMIAAQAGFFREVFDRYKKSPIGDAGISGQTGQLWVDVNSHNLDGSVNPYFGRTYIGVTEPRTQLQPAKWDTTRGQLAYRLDLSREENALKWLGTHQFSGYYEYKYRVNRQYSYRDVITSDHPWLQTGVGGVVSNWARGSQNNVTGGPQAGPNILRGFFRYYVGDADGTNVDYAPSQYSYGNYNLFWGTTNNWRNESITFGEAVDAGNTGMNNNLRQTIKTTGGVVQSHFLDGKIVTTFGSRQDKVYSRRGARPIQLLNNNTEFDYSITDSWVPGGHVNDTATKGPTKTAGVVVRPFRDLAGVNKWADQGTGAKGFFGELLRGMSLHYNVADSFIIAPPNVDLYFNALPNTTAEGEDYGVTFNMFDGKLVVRVNHYDITQLNIQDGDANTIAQRVLRLDLDISSDNYQLYDRATDWWSLTNPGWSAEQVRTAVLNQMQMEPERYDRLVTEFRAGTIAATNDLQAKGTEIEINYNPTQHWTLAANLNEGRSINRNMSTTIQDYIDERMPVWLSIEDKNYDPNLVGTSEASRGWLPTAANPDHLWWLHSYQGSQTPQANHASFVNAPYAVFRESEGKSRLQVRRYNARVSTNLQLAAISDNPVVKRFSIGGAVRWEDKAGIGYYGVETYPEVITRLDPNRQIYDDAKYHFDAFITYKTKLWSDRIDATFRLNVVDLTESGGLQPIGAFPNGVPHSYRIVDPRKFILTASFDL